MAKRKTWRCFHCDEVFTSERWAREHFGVDMGDTPACKIEGSKGHLLGALRNAQMQLRRYLLEDNDTLRAYQSVLSEKAEAVRKAEEEGYARGVRDMKAQGYCVEPKKHDVC